MSATLITIKMKFINKKKFKIFRYSFLQKLYNECRDEEICIGLIYFKTSGILTTEVLMRIAYIFFLNRE